MRNPRMQVLGPRAPKSSRRPLAASLPQRASPNIPRSRSRSSPPTKAAFRLQLRVACCCKMSAASRWTLPETASESFQRLRKPKQPRGEICRGFATIRYRRRLPDVTTLSRSSCTLLQKCCSSQSALHCCCNSSLQCFAYAASRPKVKTVPLPWCGQSWQWPRCCSKRMPSSSASPTTSGGMLAAHSSAMRLPSGVGFLAILRIWSQSIAAAAGWTTLHSAQAAYLAGEACCQICWSRHRSDVGARAVCLPVLLRQLVTS